MEYATVTVARYYRPNGKNIHRGKDATEDDEWGYSDDGLVVELDEDTIDDLAKRWRLHPIRRLPTLRMDRTDDTRNQVWLQ